MSTFTLKMDVGAPAGRATPGIGNNALGEPRDPQKLRLRIALPTPDAGAHGSGVWRLGEVHPSHPSSTCSPPGSAEAAATADGTGSGASAGSSRSQTLARC